MDVTVAVLDGFERFVSDASLFALPLQLSSGQLEPLPAIPFPKGSDSNYQIALSQLESIVNEKSALYLIVRRNSSLIAVTYVPYRADANLKQSYLENRQELIQKLGESHFYSALICKEAGEVTDARSWDERDGQGASWGENHEHGDQFEACVKEENGEKEVFKDLGYKKNRCRLCDRRMKNKIAPDALDALKNLGNSGDCVQIVGFRNERPWIALTTLVCRHT
jgi:twinfilin-like protein